MAGRAAVAAALFVLLFVLASPAGADTCALTDPECLTDTLEETVDDVGGTVGTVGDDVDREVEEAAETVEDTATGVVAKVGEVVDGLLGKGGDPDPGGGGGKDDAPGPGRSRKVGRGSEGAAAPVIRRSQPREPGVDVVFLTDGEAPRSTSGSDSDPADTLAERARQLAFPAFLAAMVLAFLVIQNRVDRRDPRLASAPLGPELLTFE